MKSSVRAAAALALVALLALSSVVEHAQAGRVAAAVKGYKERCLAVSIPTPLPGLSVDLAFRGQAIWDGLASGNKIGREMQLEFSAGVRYSLIFVTIVGSVQGRVTLTSDAAPSFPAMLRTFAASMGRDVVRYHSSGNSDGDDEAITGVREAIPAQVTKTFKPFIDSVSAAGDKGILARSAVAFYTELISMRVANELAAVARSDVYTPFLCLGTTPDAKGAQKCLRHLVGETTFDKKVITGGYAARLTSKGGGNYRANGRCEAVQMALLRLLQAYRDAVATNLYGVKATANFDTFTCADVAAQMAVKAPTKEELAAMEKPFQDWWTANAKAAGGVKYPAQFVCAALEGHPRSHFRDASVPDTMDGLYSNLFEFAPTDGTAEVEADDDTMEAMAKANDERKKMPRCTADDLKFGGKGANVAKGECGLPVPLPILHFFRKFAREIASIMDVIHVNTFKCNDGYFLSSLDYLENLVRSFPDPVVGALANPAAPGAVRNTRDIAWRAMRGSKRFQAEKAGAGAGGGGGGLRRTGKGEARKVFVDPVAEDKTAEPRPCDDTRALLRLHPKTPSSAKLLATCGYLFGDSASATDYTKRATELVNAVIAQQTAATQLEFKMGVEAMFSINVRVGFGKGATVDDYCTAVSTNGQLQGGVFVSFKKEVQRYSNMMVASSQFTFSAGAYVHGSPIPKYPLRLTAMVTTNPLTVTFQVLLPIPQAATAPPASGGKALSPDVDGIVAGYKDGSLASSTALLYMDALASDAVGKVMEVFSTLLGTKLATPAAELKGAADGAGSTGSLPKELQGGTAALAAPAKDVTTATADGFTALEAKDPSKEVSGEKKNKKGKVVGFLKAVGGFLADSVKGATVVGAKCAGTSLASKMLGAAGAKFTIGSMNAQVVLSVSFKRENGKWAWNGDGTYAELEWYTINQLSFNVAGAGVTIYMGDGSVMNVSNLNALLKKGAKGGAAKGGKVKFAEQYAELFSDDSRHASLRRSGMQAALQPVLAELGSMEDNGEL